MAGILEGIRVVSMGQVVVIPAASTMLADWGAEVIKLESLIGEQHRGMRQAQGIPTGEINWVMQVLNRNKKGLAINLKTPEGIEAVHKLIKTTDVFMYNYEYSSLKEFKLDYKTLSEVNPRIIHASVTGYGRKGPDKDERGYDPIQPGPSGSMCVHIGRHSTHELVCLYCPTQMLGRDCPVVKNV